jgi:hypothetical protein
MKRLGYGLGSVPTLTLKHLTGKTFALKMVDYSGILLPDETMHRAIPDVLR